jgi:hypothetical protein
MNSIGVIPATIAALVAILGWYTAHYFSVRREIAAEKRKTRVSFLLEAYRRLENAGNRRIDRNSKLIGDIESALADIQLLGTPEQVGLARDFSDEFSKNGKASFDPLLYGLRKTLRQELDLEPVEHSLKILRITYDN